MASRATTARTRWLRSPARTARSKNSSCSRSSHRRSAQALARSAAGASLWEGAARSFIEIAEDAATQIVAPEYSLVTPEEVAAAHEAGLQVITWTANSVEDWKRLIAAGVDGIITDDPAGLIAHLRNTANI